MQQNHMVHCLHCVHCLNINQTTVFRVGPFMPFVTCLMSTSGCQNVFPRDLGVTPITPCQNPVPMATSATPATPATFTRPLYFRVQRRGDPDQSEVWTVSSKICHCTLSFVGPAPRITVGAHRDGGSGTITQVAELLLAHKTPRL